MKSYFLPSLVRSSQRVLIEEQPTRVQHINHPTNHTRDLEAG